MFLKKPLPSKGRSVKGSRGKFKLEWSWSCPDFPLYFNMKISIIDFYNISSTHCYKEVEIISKWYFLKENIIH